MQNDPRWYHRKGDVVTLIGLESHDSLSLTIDKAGQIHLISIYPVLTANILLRVDGHFQSISYTRGYPGN